MLWYTNVCFVKRNATKLYGNKHCTIAIYTYMFVVQRFSKGFKFSKQNEQPMKILTEIPS